WRRRRRRRPDDAPPPPQASRLGPVTATPFCEGAPLHHTQHQPSSKSQLQRQRRRNGHACALLILLCSESITQYASFSTRHELGHQKHGRREEEKLLAKLVALVSAAAGDADAAVNSMAPRNQFCCCLLQSFYTLPNPLPRSSRRGASLRRRDEEDDSDDDDRKEEAVELEMLRSERRAVRLPRSHSTGQSLVASAAAAAESGDHDRFTLRLPQHVRKGQNGHKNNYLDEKLIFCK
uniref:Uncharacterized protein n=1 Tax=Oryza glaberrima TaxID=4538 RepID=I1R4V4_ORYGL